MSADERRQPALQGAVFRSTVVEDGRLGLVLRAAPLLAMGSNLHPRPTSRQHHNRQATSPNLHRSNSRRPVTAAASHRACPHEPPWISSEAQSRSTPCCTSSLSQGAMTSPTGCNSVPRPAPTSPAAAELSPTQPQQPSTATPRAHARPLSGMPTARSDPQLTRSAPDAYLLDSIAQSYLTHVQQLQLSKEAAHGSWGACSSEQAAAASLVSTNRGQAESCAPRAQSSARARPRPPGSARPATGSAKVATQRAFGGGAAPLSLVMRQLRDQVDSAASAAAAVSGTAAAGQASRLMNSRGSSSSHAVRNPPFMGVQRVQARSDDSGQHGLSASTSGDQHGVPAGAPVAGRWSFSGHLGGQGALPQDPLTHHRYNPLPSPPSPRPNAPPSPSCHPLASSAPQPHAPPATPTPQACPGPGPPISSPATSPAELQQQTTSTQLLWKAVAAELEPWMITASTGWSLRGSDPSPASTWQGSPALHARQQAQALHAAAAAGAGAQGEAGAGPPPARHSPRGVPTEVAAAVAAASQRIRERCSRPESSRPAAPTTSRNKGGFEGSSQLLQSLHHWRKPVFLVDGAVRPAKELTAELAALEASPFFGWGQQQAEDLDPPVPATAGTQAAPGAAGGTEARGACAGTEQPAGGAVLAAVLAERGSAGTAGGRREVGSARSRLFQQTAAAHRRQPLMRGRKQESSSSGEPSEGSEEESDATDDDE